MNASAATVGMVASIVVALGLVHVPLGDYMYRVYTGARHTRLETTAYRVMGVNPDAAHSGPAYTRAVLAFSAVGILLLYFVLLIQHHLPLPPPPGSDPVTPDLAWNTAVSFATNTDWQAYAGEKSMGYLAQMAGLGVQNFCSAAVGMAVAIALVRGFTRTRTGGVGNFWVDLVRGILRILLPIAVVAAVVLVAGGAVQNFHENPQTVQTLSGSTQSLPGGPVAGQQSIMLLGTNGGGFYNANSAHPFENPTAWTNWLAILLLLMIAFSLPRTFGRMVNSRRQGYAIVAVMAVLALVSVTAACIFQVQHHGTVPTAVGAATEGVEQRFGVPDSALFASATTLTGTGATDSAHDSYTSLGGMMTMFNMQLGEVAPGGVGAGLYGMLVLAVITVFVAGLMVGRTPEYLGKKITSREIKLSAAYFLTSPLLALTGTAASVAVRGRSDMLNNGPHGVSEVLYAFTSAAHNNGSAFAGLSVDNPWYNTTLGIAMLLGRYIPIILILALAGSLASQGTIPASVGTLPTYRPQFIGMVVAVTVILVALTFLPMLALGPLAEGIH